eukprot:4053654-Prymnesium_polylepis.1
MKAATSGMMKCRRDLRVNGVLQTWWETAQAEMVAASQRSDVMDAERYTQLFKSVYRALASEYDEAEASEMVAADWEDLMEDLEEGSEPGVLSENDFKQSVFELAMMWVMGVEPKKYAAFLQKLLDQ